MQKKMTLDLFLFFPDVHVGFIISATGPDSKTYTHQLMKETVRSVIEALGYDNGKYSVIAHVKEVKSMGFNTGYSDFIFLTNVDSTPREHWSSPALHKDLEEARNIFDTTKIDEGSKKVKYIAL